LTADRVAPPHRGGMTNRSRLALLALAGCTSAQATPPKPEFSVAAIANLRAMGPAMLASLLQRYDRTPPGPARDELALAIDHVAGQRYATVSRLYWYTDLDAAETAARMENKPILSLRMLGRLDEDLSCANSRLFRATLYANATVSAFLRDRFILHWSSERPVPRVTIDFGDGRKLERTVTGNSAHYILDDAGHVLDVLPGLYSARGFVTELTRSAALADLVRGKGDTAREAAVTAYHEAIAKPPTMPPSVGSVALAQRQTASKAAIEVRDLRLLAPETNPAALPDDSPQWYALGRGLYPTRIARALDPQSRALVERLHDGALGSTPEQREAMIGRLERTILADTALDQLKLRPQIARRIAEAKGHIDFATLNEWVYAEVFHTPKSDPWLGMLPRTDFTGLPGDGVAM
jgi:hypothetical protein